MKETPQQRLGKELRRKRIRKGMTLDQLSGTSGVNKGHLSDIENGKVKIKLETLDMIINALRGDRRKLYSLYISQLTSIESCLQLILRCLEKNDSASAKRAMRKLFSIAPKGRISTKSVDKLIIFFDK